MGPRIAVPSASMVSAAAGGDHLAITEIGGPLRILDSDGRERARVGDHFRFVVHDPVTDTWVAIREPSDGRQSLLRLSHDAEVVEQRPCGYWWDVATMRGGSILVLLSDAGLQLLDCSDWSLHTLRASEAGG